MPKVGYKITDETRKKLSIANSKPRPWQKNRNTPESISRMRVSLKKIVRSEEWRKNISLAKRGKKNPQWKGGVTPELESIRRTAEYKLWRKAVFERDNYTCIWGGESHGSRLNADHIKPFAHYPELRFAIDNGRTLCEKCHATTDTWGGRSKKSKL